MVTEVKQGFSRLGYIVGIPLAVGMTVRSMRDGRLVLSLLCLVSVAVVAGFFFLEKPALLPLRA